MRFFQAPILIYIYKNHIVKLSIGVILIFGLTIHTRYNSLSVWNYLHEGQQVVSTPDAAYFVKEASRIKSGQIHQTDTDRMWPDNAIAAKKQAELHHNGAIWQVIDTSS